MSRGSEDARVDRRLYPRRSPGVAARRGYRSLAGRPEHHPGPDQSPARAGRGRQEETAGGELFMIR